MSGKLSLNKEQIFVVLKEQNEAFHQPLPQLFKRKHSQNLSSLVSTKQVTILEGLRRSGKTTVLRELQALLLSGCERKQILYIDLEDHRFINSLGLALVQESLALYQERVAASGQIYVFIEGINVLADDERRELNDWMLSVPKIKFILSYSGQGAKQYFAAASSYRIYPLSYSEWVLATQQSFGALSFAEYLQKGGLALLNGSGLDYAAYLDSVLMRDVVEQHQIRNVNILKRLAIYLISSIGERFSYNKAAQDLDASINTIRDYVVALEASGLFILVDEASSSSNSTSQSKVHVVDNGLARALNLGLELGLTENLIENTILLELKQSDVEVFYHKAKRECDFVIKRDGAVELLQVIESAQSIRKVDSDIRIKGLIEARDNYASTKAVVLSADGSNLVLASQAGDIVLMPVWQYIKSSQLELQVL